ncbi:PREDICTED: E3 ubiquitin-protein ligase TRIM71-like [Amphimedon queenslandica]|uniref:B box-type domain-containing protein n=1 Tax=Amphimedon queenslandica TaxID=400682 RepID=A0AAN0JK33_AMPQE|nr:PREDICTED: E3 ubiquitin-protein ligase TRIM71-like [Amphimedon queenslandica]|eukprot:XP_019857333.1 PREDICTED: E3 ubiquitin-protein ligase TRIM71-like [Amphimedon queenslandica]
MGAFPVTFTLNNLKEIYNLMKKVADPQQVPCDNCTEANTTGYCKDCRKFMCAECINMHERWVDFSNHQLTNLNEVTASIFSTSQLLAPAKQEYCPIPGHDELLKIYCETCDSVICHDCTVRTHKNHDYDLVSASFTKHCQELKGSLNPLKEKVEALKKVVSALAERENEIRERGKEVLEDIHVMVEDMINVLYQSEQKLTEQAKRITNDKLTRLSEQMKSAKLSLSLLEDVNDYVEQSVKTGSPQQVLRSKKQMIERMNEVAQINVEKLHPQEKADFILSEDIKSLYHIGNIISGTPALHQCRVKKIDYITPTGKAVSFSLSMEAPDSSLLSVPLSSLQCSLVPIVIPFNPYLDSNTPVRTILKLNRPYGIAISDDNHVIITEYYSDCVTILDRQGKKVKSLGGEGGKGDVKFSAPRGLAITPDKFILVSDRSANGQFKAPRGIAVDSQGLVYVTDANNHRIQKFSPDGKFVGHFGSKGSGPGQLNKPNGIAIDTAATGLVYVSEWSNNCLSVFTREGVFICRFGKGGSDIDQFRDPIGLTFDKNGFLYVCDNGNNRIVVY